MHKLHYITYIQSNYIVSNKIHKPLRGQPPKKGQKCHSQSVLLSEVPLYYSSTLGFVYSIYYAPFGDRISPVDGSDYVLSENTHLCTHFMYICPNLPTDYTLDLLTNLILSAGDNPDLFHDLTILRCSFASYLPF